MGFLLSTGRVLFVILFVVSGIMKLTDISGTAALIAQKLIIPPALTQYVLQIEATTTVPFAKILAVLAGVTEVVCAVMIAFGLARRTFAVLLLLYVVAATVLMHDFWNATAADRMPQLIAALKNLSLAGALLLIAGQGPAEEEEDRRLASYDGH